MKIKEYFKDYIKYNKYEKEIKEGKFITIEDFYNDCIKFTEIDPQIVLHWHNMLLDYIKLPNAIFWIRKYEKGKKSNKNQYMNRRASLTKYKDGTTIVYVSNFDVQEIYNMMNLKILPTAEEFLELMISNEYCLHYDSGGKSEESRIASFPNIGEVYSGVLTKSGWYLAHIEAVNGNYLQNNKEYKQINLGKNGDEIFPRGTLKDWKKKENIYIRNLPYSLDPEDKKLVIAHFLRFVDPLNYFLVPSEKNEKHDRIIAKKIGESPELISYIREKKIEIYGEDTLKEYHSLIRSRNNLKSTKDYSKMKINCEYRKGINHKESKINLDGLSANNFLKKLLKYKKAKIVYHFKNGKKLVEYWKAKKITINSDIIKNIKSRKTWRDKNQEIKNVDVSIVDNNDSSPFL